MSKSYEESEDGKLSLDEALNRYTNNEEKNGDWKYIVADSNDPSKRIYCHAYQAEYKGEQYIKTDYEVYKGKECVLSTNDGRFDGRTSSFWKELKQYMIRAGEFSGEFIRFSNNQEYKNWAKQATVHNAKAVKPVEKYSNNKAQLEELRNMIIQLQQNQQPIQQTTVQSAIKPQTDINEVKPEQGIMIPIISTSVIKHEQRIEELKDRRAFQENKVSEYQGKAEKLTAKADRLTATNQMLAELLARGKMPAAVINSVRALMRSNETKAADIRNEKLPKLEGKINKCMTKMESIDKKINLRQSKIDRYTSLNNVITSFTHGDRKQFSTSLDELHNNTIKMLNAKIDLKTESIVKLTEFYKQSPVRATAARVPSRLTSQKNSRQRLIQKRNKLMGVIIPYKSQPEQVQDTVMKQAEGIITNAAKQENIAPAEVAENVVLSAVSMLPERSIEVPNTREEEMYRLMPEIAAVMDMPVSQLESKPRDLRDILILDYTNNFESTPEEIQESLARLMNPDVRTEEKIEKRQEKAETEKTDGAVTDGNVKKENPLKNAEQLAEGNANMIDGIINNEPPKKEETKKDEPKKEAPKEEKKQGFSFSVAQLKRNAKNISQQPNPPKNVHKPPDHGAI